MIIVRLKGGVGNQLFQFALGYSLHIHYRQPLQYDVTSYLVDPLRKFELQPLGLVLANDYDRNLFFKPGIAERVKRRLKFHSIYRIVKEAAGKEFSFSNDIFDSKARGTYLDGYWQNINYFAEVKEQIKFILSSIDLKYFSQDQFQTQDAVAIHVRRGDFITNPNTVEVYCSLGVDYYHAAMSYFRKIRPGAQFYFFSDDIAWCKANFKDSDVSFIDSCEAPFYELLFMSRMHHHIIANSTFSWWAAWLNTRPDHIVIAPENWFINREQNGLIKNLFAPHWIGM